MKLAQAIKRGFTLIELLVVIGILAILLAITLIAINPARQFQQANDTKRASDVNSILNAVGQYAADNRGALPPGVTATPQVISFATTGATFCTALVPKYIASLPVDPTTSNGLATPGTGVAISAAGCADTGYATGYSIVTSATDNRVTVSAVSQVNPATPISVTR